MKPLIIDIYHGDPVNSFAQVKTFGILGVIHKASQGTETVDRAYATRRKLALTTGLLWGAYHFMSLADPDDQTLLALDWENVGGSSPTADQARAFLEAIETTIGRKAVVY